MTSTGQDATLLARRTLCNLEDVCTGAPALFGLTPLELIDDEMVERWLSTGRGLVAVSRALSDELAAATGRPRRDIKKPRAWLRGRVAARLVAPAQGQLQSPVVTPGASPTSSAATVAREPAFARETEDEQPAAYRWGVHHMEDMLARGDYAGVVHQLATSRAVLDAHADSESGVARMAMRLSEDDPCAWRLAVAHARGTAAAWGRLSGGAPA